MRALRNWAQPDAVQSAAQQAYLQIIAHSRLERFYAEFAVSDTVDGRFDVIVLNLFLVIHRLQQEPATEAFIRVLSELFFADMDRSLREMGSTDTGVGIRVKKMAKAFYGRLQAYEQSLADPVLFKECLLRNLYRSREQAPVDQMLAYVRRNEKALHEQPLAQLVQGIIRLAP